MRIETLMIILLDIVADTPNQVAEKALLTAIKHKSWLDARESERLLNDLSQNQELDRIFGPGAALLAIEFQGPGSGQPGQSEQAGQAELSEQSSGGGNISVDSESSDAETDDVIDTLGENGGLSSTPTRGMKRIKKPVRDSTDSISPIGEPPDNYSGGSVSSSFKVDGVNSTRESEGSKKFKLDDNLEDKLTGDETSPDIFKEGIPLQAETFLSEVTGGVLHKCSSTKGDMEED